MLKLEQLEVPGALRRGGHVVQLPLLVGEHQTHRRRVTDGGGVVGQVVQEVDQVEVGDQRVGYLDEHS